MRVRASMDTAISMNKAEVLDDMLNNFEEVNLILGFVAMKLSLFNSLIINCLFNFRKLLIM